MPIKAGIKKFDEADEEKRGNPISIFAAIDSSQALVSPMKCPKNDRPLLEPLT